MERVRRIQQDNLVRVIDVLHDATVRREGPGGPVIASHLRAIVTDFHECAVPPPPLHRRARPLLDEMGAAWESGRELRAREAGTAICSMRCSSRSRPPIALSGR